MADGFMVPKAKILGPYSAPKFSDFYTLSQTKLLNNPSLHSSTYQYLYSLYVGVPPPRDLPSKH